jgi:hypothetical protein
MLVYVVGTGRCGSTLLDIVLGADPTVQSTGELMMLAESHGGLARTCSCGRLDTECPFWTAVTNRAGGVPTLQALSSGLKFEGTKGMLSAMVRARWRRGRVRRHADDLGRVVQAVAAESRKARVVDSSKSLGRGYLYSYLPSSGIDVRYIHMVRDGRAFLWSKTARPDGEAVGKRPPERSPRRLAILWATTNFLASTVFPRLSRPYLRIRYEDLTTQPAATLRQVGAFLGVDLAPVIRMVEDGTPIPTQHVVGGNRLRFSQRLTLRADAEWERSLPMRDRRTFWRFAGWLARRYGYTRESPVASPPAVPATT